MRKYFALAVAAAAVATALAVTLRPRHRQGHPVPMAPADAMYATAIQPIFDRRCVVCHACFDASCQLSLQSFEGLDRGANNGIVYYPQRATEAKPTRLFQDAQTTAGWQSEFDFFPVVDRSGPADLGRSILWRFLSQRAEYPRGTGFDVDHTTTCPRTLADVETEFQHRPERGMPFGFPPLTGAQSDAIAAWLRRGAGGPPDSSTASAVESVEIGKWERFLNGSDPRMPLVAAYVFEHLFYAHFWLDGAPGAWFRVVRSRTPPGSPIDEIATRRPTDDPGSAPFFYRLRRIHETLVEKTHVPYQLSDAKLARLRQLFLDASWSVPPTHDRGHPNNPFLTFAAIPPRSRYQFLLDDARYHIQTFIHGPVCRGEAALDAIDEHFLIFFLAPESDPAVTDPDYLGRVAKDLALPSESGSKIEALSPGYEVKEIAYLGAQARRAKARALDDVWHGDGSNPDAVLTVFRHYDNAFVLRGALGGMPKTAWVVDYPIFERLCYDLVAGFDVYGNVTHQLGARIYMNFLRIESEGQFLRFLPAGERDRVHNEWYRERISQALSGIHGKAYAGPESLIAYPDGTKAKQELVTRLLTRELPPAVVGPREPIQWMDVPLSADPARARFEVAMRGLVHRPAPYVAVFPDTVLVRVKTGATGSDLVYTLARNRAHKSVEFILAEGVELEPAEDSLQIVSGIATSRPNFFLTVDEAHLDQFVADWRALAPDDGSWGAFAARYGARRSDPAFWDTSDFFAEAFPALDPLGAAVLDLSRYSND